MKRMFVFPIFIILTQNAFALECEIIDEKTGCPVGCGWNNDDAFCEPCSAGMYGPGGYEPCVEVERINLYAGTKFNYKAGSSDRWPGTSVSYFDKSVEYVVGIGFRMDDSADWNDYLPVQALQPTNYLKTFLGYAEDCSSDQVFNSEGYLNEPDYTVDDVPSSLVACWKNKEIEINYAMKNKSGDGVVTATLKRYCMVNDEAGQLEYYEDGKLTDQKCVAMEYDISKYYVEPGKVFSHYRCFYQSPGSGMVSCGNVTTTDALNKIPVPASAVFLEPVFSDCPAGYYCNAGDQQPCPPGTTSDAGATSIDDCEMRGGPNGVKFCDSIGCFHLPAGTVIKPYQP